MLLKTRLYYFLKLLSIIFIIAGSFSNLSAAGNLGKPGDSSEQGPEKTGKLSDTDSKNNSALINRRVLVLDFINVKNSPDYAYLEGSIPEAFLDPLIQTKSFELLLRTTWAKYVTQQKFKKEDAYKEEVAVEAGKEAGADVVVIGQFVAMTDRIQIFAKAIEVSSGRIMVSQNTVGPLDNDLFNVIEKMANKMAIEMKDKLPPLPASVIIEQRIKYVTGPTSKKAMIEQARNEVKAEKWRKLESEEARRWRIMEQDQALKWRMHQATTQTYKEQQAIIAANYWAQPLSMRLLGNIFTGSMIGGAMGFFSGLGMSPIMDIQTSGISAGTGAGLGLVAGILVTVYDNAHFHDRIIGTTLLRDSTLWYGFGGLAGSAIGLGIGYLQFHNFDTTAVLNGFTIGSLTGLGFGITMTILASLQIIPEEPFKKVSISSDLDRTLVVYTNRF